MTFQQLNDVIAIAETGSFNRAAERLYITQPSLTSAIKELERELGVVLFNRSGKGATLTADGVNFLPYARSVIMCFLQDRNAETVKDAHCKSNAKVKCRRTIRFYSAQVSECHLSHSSASSLE